MLVNVSADRPFTASGVRSDRELVQKSSHCHSNDDSNLHSESARKVAMNKLLKWSLSVVCPLSYAAAMKKANQVSGYWHSDT